MSVINLRGCNGAGKSQIAKQLIGDNFDYVSLGEYKERKRLEYIVGNYNKDLDLIVVGPYFTQCGGCDAIPSQDLIISSVKQAARLAGNVLFEGALISTIYTRYHLLSQSLGGMIWAYLDTPEEVCLERIQSRSGSNARFATLSKHYLEVQRIKKRAVNGQEKIVDIPYLEGFKIVKSLFV